MRNPSMSYSRPTEAIYQNQIIQFFHVGIIILHCPHHDPIISQILPITSAIKLKCSICKYIFHHKYNQGKVLCTEHIPLYIPSQSS